MFNKGSNSVKVKSVIEQGREERQVASFNSPGLAYSRKVGAAFAFVVHFIIE